MSFVGDGTANGTLIVPAGDLVGKTKLSPALFKVSSPALNTTETIYNGITHTASQLFTFRVTRETGSNDGNGQVKITYKTAKTHEVVCFTIVKEAC